MYCYTILFMYQVYICFSGSVDMIQLAGLGGPTINNTLVKATRTSNSQVYCGSVVAPKYLSVLLLLADGRSSSRRLVCYLVMTFFTAATGGPKG